MRQLLPWLCLLAGLNLPTPAYSATTVTRPVRLEHRGFTVYLSGEVSFDGQGHPRSATELLTDFGRRIEPSQTFTWFSGDRKLELGACGIQQPVRFHEDGSYESGCWLTHDEEFSIQGQLIVIRGTRDFRERLSDADVVPYLVMHSNGIPAQGVLAKAVSFAQDGWTIRMPGGSNLGFFKSGRLAEAYVDSLPLRKDEKAPTHTGLVTLFENGRPHIVDMIRVPSGDDPTALANFPLFETSVVIAGRKISVVQMLEYDFDGHVRALVSNKELTLASAEASRSPLTIAPFTIIFLDRSGRVESTRTCDQSFAPYARCSLELRKDPRLQFGWNVWQRRWLPLLPN